MMAGTMPHPTKKNAQPRKNTPQQCDSGRTSNGDLYGTVSTWLSWSSSIPARNNEDVNDSQKAMMKKRILT